MKQRPVSSLNQVKKNNAYKPLYESNIVGMQAKVKGTVGTKELKHFGNDYVNQTLPLQETDRSNS